MEKEKAESDAAAAESPGVSPGSTEGAAQARSWTSEEVEQLKKKSDERDAYRNELLRAKADLDNYQKRMRKERPSWEDQAVRRFLRDILPVADNLERALSHSGSGGGPATKLEEGVRLTSQMLDRVLKDHGIEEIPALGGQFNPELHEAVSEVEVSDQPTGRVLEVLEKGYRHRDTVLRPSRVNVARNARDTKTSARPANDGASTGGSGNPAS